MTFTWLAERGRDEGRLADILHASAKGIHYLVYVADEAKDELGLDECKAIAKRHIFQAPSVMEVIVRSRDG
jgi:hypothetical protein